MAFFKKKDKNQKNFFLGKIETKDEALKIVKESAMGFFVLAAIQATVGIMINGIYGVIDGVIVAIFAFLLFQFKSRIVAGILFLYSLFVLYSTTMNQFGGQVGGKNILLAVIIVWISFRAIQATIIINK